VAARHLEANKDGKWIIQNMPIAVVERYQKELLEVVDAKQMPINVALLCSTFPQARRAVASGYAAILPTAAFNNQDLSYIKKFPIPFPLPQIENDDARISLIWSPGLEHIIEELPQILSAFRTVRGEASKQSVKIK
jgi:hypothetical protein